MDDYNIDSLTESKNEWTVRLVNTLLPHLNDGIVSIFNEAYKLLNYQNINLKSKEILIHYPYNFSMMFKKIDNCHPPSPASGATEPCMLWHSASCLASCAHGRPGCSHQAQGTGQESPSISFVFTDDNPY